MVSKVWKVKGYVNKPRRQKLPGGFWYIVIFLVSLLFILTAWKQEQKQIAGTIAEMQKLSKENGAMINSLITENNELKSKVKVANVCEPKKIYVPIQARYRPQPVTKRTKLPNNRPSIHRNNPYHITITDQSGIVRYQQR